MRTAVSRSSVASRSIRAARGRSSGPRCDTTSSSRSSRSTTSRHRARTSRARSGRRAVSARATSDPGPSMTSSPPVPDRARATCSATRSSVVTGVPRSPRRWVAETSRHSAAQPGLVLGEQGDPRVPGVDRRAAPGRLGAAGLAATGLGPAGAAQRGVDHRRAGEQPAGLDREVDAEHRADAGRLRGPGELHRAVDPVAVGQRQGVHAVLRGPLDEHVRVGGAVAQRVAGGHVEVDEGVAGHGRSLVGSGWTVGRAGRSARVGRWSGRVGRSGRAVGPSWRAVPGAAAPAGGRARAWSRPGPGRSARRAAGRRPPAG